MYPAKNTVRFLEYIKEANVNINKKVPIFIISTQLKEAKCVVMKHSSLIMVQIDLRNQWYDPSNSMWLRNSK